MSLRSKISDAKIYVRNGSEIWTTGEALDESIKFDQILIVLLLTSRKGIKTEAEIKSFQILVGKIKDSVEGSILWLANQDIFEAADELNKFRIAVDQSLFLKVIPKSDSSFQSGALLEFFENSNIMSGRKNLYAGSKSPRSLKS